MIPTDAQLLATAKVEITKKPPQTGAFEAILFRYEKLIHYIARRYFNNREDALDASQEASLKIYNGLSKVIISESDSLKPWICTVIARTCIDALRKNRITTMELTEEVIALPSSNETVEDTIVGRERVNEILEAMQLLSKEYRIVIILRDMQGLSYDEIADTLNMNVGTVKSRLSRARAALKKIL